MRRPLIFFLILLSPLSTLSSNIYLVNKDNSKNQLHDQLNNCNSKKSWILQNVFRNVLFFSTNLSQSNFLYCLRFPKQTKNFSIARTPTEMKQNLLYWLFFFEKIFVSSVKLLNISLDEQYLFLGVPYLICETLLKVN